MTLLDWTVKDDVVVSLDVLHIDVIFVFEPKWETRAWLTLYSEIFGRWADLIKVSELGDNIFLKTLLGFEDLVLDGIQELESIDIVKDIIPVRCDFKATTSVLLPTQMFFGLNYLGLLRNFLLTLKRKALLILLYIHFALFLLLFWLILILLECNLQTLQPLNFNLFLLFDNFITNHHIPFLSFLV